VASSANFITIDDAASFGIAGAFTAQAIPFPRYGVFSRAGSMPITSATFDAEVDAPGVLVQELARHRRLPRAESVAQPELDGVQPDLERDLVHLLLERPVDLLHAETPVGAADGSVRVDADAVALDIGKFVRAAAGVARRADDVDP